MSDTNCVVTIDQSICIIRFFPKLKAFGLVLNRFSSSFLYLYIEPILKLLDPIPTVSSSLTKISFALK